MGLSVGSWGVWQGRQRVGKIGTFGGDASQVVATLDLALSLQGQDGAKGDRGEDGEPGQPVSD